MKFLTHALFMEYILYFTILCKVNVYLKGNDKIWWKIVDCKLNYQQTQIRIFERFKDDLYTFCTFFFGSWILILDILI